jgi:acetylornithine deacetylase/succinyl-diaminopimelate desuccinylase-like protein
MDIEKVLAELVELPSSSGEELKAQQLVAEKLSKLNFQVQLQEVYPNRPNVLAQRGRKGPLLVTHIDTFPPLEHPAPYELKRQGDTAFGRGVLDAKGQIAALLKALSLSQAPCQVAITVDEEEEGEGSKRLGLEAEMAVVLEPTNLQIGVAEAGSIEAKIEVWGKEAHIDMPSEGVNAIHQAFDVFRQIKTLPFMQVRHPLFGHPWASVTQVSGGKVPGVLPSSCEMMIEVAVLPNVSAAQAVSELEGLFISQAAFHEILDISPPFEIKKSEAVVKKVFSAVRKVLGKKPSLVGFPSWSDAQNLVKEGIPTVIFGAGFLAKAHTADEQVSLGDLEKLSLVLIEFLESL